MRYANAFCEICTIGGGKEVISTLEFLIEKDNSKFGNKNNFQDHILNRSNSNGERPLYLACKNGNLEIVKFLISKKAIVNLKSK